jgi:hypothetical protein
MSHLLRVVTSVAPFSITDAEIEALGYVVVTRAPYNADPTGTSDSTSALQLAIDDAFADAKPVWIPSGTYLVTNTLRCYMWGDQTNGGNPHIEFGHQIFGATPRPVIKVHPTNPTAGTRFGDANNPRPVVGFACWRPSTGSLTIPDGTFVTSTPTAANHIPDSPYILTGSYHPSTGLWTQAVSILFDCTFHNIDIDTSQKAGADGIFIATAQGVAFGNCRVVATDSNVGIQGMPGRSAIAMNIEVEGGDVGVDASWPLGDGGAIAGGCVAGLRCYNQTTANIQAADFIPFMVVGFHFTKSAGSSWIAANSAQTAANGLTLIDGVIETFGTALDNTQAQALYIRNVYVTGTTNLVRTNATTLTGSGTWKLINEYNTNAGYAATKIDPGTASNGASALAHYYYLDGVEQTRAQIQISDRTNNVAAPDPDAIVDKHIVEVPMVDDGEFINIKDAPYNCVSGGADCRAGIQQAISDAAAEGHNRVFVPWGTFHVGSSTTAGTITLGANTKLFGTGIQTSIIRPRSAWVPADGTSPYIIDTPSNVSGTAQIGFLSIFMPGSIGDMGRWSHLRWRVGRRSSTYGVQYDRAGIGGGSASENHPWGRQVFTLSGNGGGRHYLHYTKGDANNGANFRAIQINSTTEPTIFYGFNCEAAASFGASTLPESAYPETYAEVNNASNIRFYSCKREGQSPTVTLTNCTNIGLFSGGGMRDGEIGTADTPTFVSRYHEIMGSCEGIVMANVVVQNFVNGVATSVDYTLFEAESNSGIRWPNGVAIYKRGYASYDDSVMTFT